MSFKIIGGESLQGPINKLQNAVSFNYFANTHVYDKRSDTLNKDENGKWGVVLGDKNTSSVDVKPTEDDIKSETPNTDQMIDSGIDINKNTTNPNNILLT